MTKDLLLDLSADTGWTDATMLDLLCEYIDNQKDPDAIAGFLKEKAAEEEVYYQPEYNDVEWKQMSFYDHYVYHTKEAAEHDFPTLVIYAYHGDQIEDHEYVDE